MSLVTALLCRNEADKDLRRVLTDAGRYSDTILLLDDGSTDDSVAVATACGATVRVRAQHGMWGNESPARAELWAWGAAVAGDGWLLIADCDMLLQGDPRPYTASWECNTWSWPLYDLWDSETTYRCDGYWQAHLHPRPWLFRPSMQPHGWSPTWADRGLHVGHMPQNWLSLPGIATDLAWLHRAYLTKSRRCSKYEQYVGNGAHLTSHELAHALTIRD